MTGDTDAVRRLIDLGLPVDAVDAQGCTALLRAAGSGHLAVVTHLLGRGADPQRAANSGATPLSAAVSMRQTEIVAALLAAGAQIEHRLPGGVTVLMLACALGLPDIVARLLAAGADVHANDDQGLAALHCAALYGFTARDKIRLLALLDTLLLAGADPDYLAGGRVSPLLMLLGARAEPGTACDEQVVLAGVERLLDEDVALDVADQRGFGPLHLAALHGLPLLVQRLLRAGADSDRRDALNRTPREIAIMRGFIDVAGQFEPALPGCRRWRASCAKAAEPARLRAAAGAVRVQPQPAAQPHRRARLRTVAECAHAIGRTGARCRATGHTRAAARQRFGAGDGAPPSAAVAPALRCAPAALPCGLPADSRRLRLHAAGTDPPAGTHGATTAAFAGAFVTRSRHLACNTGV